VTEIFVYIEKGEKFKKRVEINWDDGAISVVKNNEIILRGRDGNVYNVLKNSEHGLICRKVILENGYSI
jgi:hypothetical protein